MTNNKDINTSSSGGVPPKPTTDDIANDALDEAVAKARNDKRDDHGKGFTNDASVLDALPMQYNTMTYTYAESRDDHIGLGSGRRAVGAARGEDERWGN